MAPLVSRAEGSQEPILNHLIDNDFRDSQIKCLWEREESTYKDEEIEDKHEVLDAAETVPLHGRPSCWSLSLPLRENNIKHNVGRAT